MEKIIPSFSLTLEKWQEKPHSLSLFNTVLEVLVVTHRERNMMYENWKYHKDVTIYWLHTWTLLKIKCENWQWDNSAK